MVDWRPHNPSNEPGTCKWCGNQLRKESHHSAAAYGRPGNPNLGDYGDGHFCGLRCGYRFGVAFAGFGKTLNPRNKS